MKEPQLTRISSRIGLTGSVRSSKLSLYRLECEDLYTVRYPVDGRTVDPRVGVSDGMGKWKIQTM